MDSLGGLRAVLFYFPRAESLSATARFYFSTFTPFQKATYPAICFAAAFGSG